MKKENKPKINIGFVSKRFINSFMKKFSNNELKKDTCPQDDGIDLTQNTVEEERKKYNSLSNTNILNNVTKDCKTHQNMNHRLEQNERTNVLSLIVDEYLPEEIKEFNKLELYVRDNNKLFLYAVISMPNVINHIQYLDFFENDPRYILYEDYDFETTSFKHMYEVIPFGQIKGVYRIFDSEGLKIKSIESLYEVEESKVLTLNRK